MNDVLNEIEKRVSKGGKYDELSNANLKLDIHKKIPDVMLDNTDRNRTSPFAFTGNKFEFRAVGSSANCALPMRWRVSGLRTACKETKSDAFKSSDKSLHFSTPACRMVS